MVVTATAIAWIALIVMLLALCRAATLGDRNVGADAGGLASAQLDRSAASRAGAGAVTPGSPADDKLPRARGAEADGTTAATG
jgi:hypothetical protein